MARQFTWLLFAIFIASFSNVAVSQERTSPALEDRGESNLASTERLLEPYREAASKWEQDIVALETDEARFGSTDTIVCLGSSSFRKWDSINEQMKPWIMLRRAYGGAKFSDLAIHIDRILKDTRFRAALIYVGNDIAVKDDDKSAEEIVALAKHVISRVQQHSPNAEVFLIALTPTPSRFAKWKEMIEANDALERAVSNLPRVHFVRTSHLFLDRDRKPNEGLFLSDRLHLNEAGYALWADTLKTQLERQLGHPKK